MAYLSSSAIEVFPAVQRGATYQPQSRLMTEETITHLYKAMWGDSFVLSKTTDTNIEFILGGYHINILNKDSLKNISTLTANAHYNLYAEANIEETSSTGYVELQGGDVSGNYQGISFSNVPVASTFVPVRNTYLKICEFHLDSNNDIILDEINNQKTIEASEITATNANISGTLTTSNMANSGTIYTQGLQIPSALLNYVKLDYDGLTIANQVGLGISSPDIVNVYPCVCSSTNTALAKEVTVSALPSNVEVGTTLLVTFENQNTANAETLQFTCNSTTAYLVCVKGGFVCKIPQFSPFPNKMYWIRYTTINGTNYWVIQNVDEEVYYSEISWISDPDYDYLTTMGTYMIWRSAYIDVVRVYTDGTHIVQELITSGGVIKTRTHNGSSWSAWKTATMT